MASRASYSSNDLTQSIVEELVERDFELVRGGSHWKIFSPDGRFVNTVAGSVSDHRAGLNFKSQIRRWLKLNDYEPLREDRIMQEQKERAEQRINRMPAIPGYSPTAPPAQDAGPKPGLMGATIEAKRERMKLANDIRWGKDSADPLRHVPPGKKLLGYDADADADFELINKMREAGKNYRAQEPILQAMGYVSVLGAPIRCEQISSFMRTRGVRLRDFVNRTSRKAAPEKAKATIAKLEGKAAATAAPTARPPFQPPATIPAPQTVQTVAMVSTPQPQVTVAPIKNPYLHDVMEIVLSNLSDDMKERNLIFLAQEKILPKDVGTGALRS